jgi:choline dehydrogenase-like flavoprotein
VSQDAWYDAAGDPFEPRVHYFVGGATKLYGAALGRLRPADFGEIVHIDGISPAWPLGYEEFEPWYAKVEWLYQVRGLHGEDPSEGSWSEEYPWPPISHEPLIQQIADDLDRAGYYPFHIPRHHAQRSEPSGQPVHSLRQVRWLSLHGARQGRR